MQFSLPKVKLIPEEKGNRERGANREDIKAMDEFEKLFGKRNNFAKMAYIDFQGHRVPKKILCKVYGISEDLLNYRLKSGMGLDEALKTPIRKYTKREKKNEKA